MKISLLLRERWSGRQGKEYLSSLSHYIKITMCINFHPYTHLFQRMVHFIVILQFRPALSGGTVSGLFLNLGLEIGNEHPVETVGCQGGDDESTSLCIKQFNGIFQGYSDTYVHTTHNHFCI